MNKKERRHTAIMPACHCQGLGSAGRFTDIVGYTSLMGSDEIVRLKYLPKTVKSTQNSLNSLMAGSQQQVSEFHLPFQMGQKLEVE